MVVISIFTSQEKQHKNLQKPINNELKKINHWVCANKLCINYSKSSFMLMNIFEQTWQTNFLVSIQL